MPPEATLRVRIVASWKDRTLNMARELGLGNEEAALYVEKTERERIQFIRDHFHKNPAEMLHYDLVLNSSRYSFSECADLVVEALHRMQRHSFATAVSA